MADEKKKIFFSYSRVDGEEFALRLATDLRKAGCNIWIDQLDIRPGKPWDLEIEKALQSATCVLFIVTEKSTASNNTLDEVYYALDNNKEVIPVIFGKCQIPFRLRRVQHIDFTHNYNTAFSRLLPALTADAKPEAAQAEEVDPGKNKTTVQPPVTEAPPAANTGQKPQNRMWLAGAGLILLLVILYFVLANRKPVTGIKDSAALMTDTTNKKPGSLQAGSAPLAGAKADTANKKPDTSRSVSTTPDKNSRAGNDRSQSPPSGTANDGKPDGTTLTDLKTRTEKLKAGGAYYRLQLKSGEKYLDASYCGTTVALNDLSDYGGGTCQLWRLVAVGGGWSKLQIKNGDQYLCADNCSGNVILRAASTFDPNDGCALWKLAPDGGGWSRLQLRQGGLYLDAVHCGANVALNPGSDFGGGTCQLWRLVPAP